MFGLGLWVFLKSEVSEVFFVVLSVCPFDELHHGKVLVYVLHPDGPLHFALFLFTHRSHRGDSPQIAIVLAERRYVFNVLRLFEGKGDGGNIDVEASFPGFQVGVLAEWSHQIVHCILTEMDTYHNGNSTKR